MTKKNHKCEICDKHITGIPRPTVWCKICKKSYLDFCPKLHKDWELRYES